MRFQQFKALNGQTKTIDKSTAAWKPQPTAPTKQRSLRSVPLSSDGVLMLSWHGAPWIFWPGQVRCYFHVWTYGYGSIPINTIFSGMNIHLPAILMFTRGTRFWHTAICENMWKTSKNLCDYLFESPLFVGFIRSHDGLSPLIQGNCQVWHLLGSKLCYTVCRLNSHLMGVKWCW